MGKGSKSNCKSTSHKLFIDKAKNRVDDLQGMFIDLQFARKDSRAIDVAVLEEQVHQMLREWKAELNEPSPASSLQQGESLGSFSTDICRLLKLCEEEDDAISHLAATKPEPNDQSLHVGDKAVFQEGLQERDFPLVNECKSSALVSNLDASHLDYQQMNFYQDFEEKFYPALTDACFYGEYAIPQLYNYLPSMFPQPSAFLGPKCVLWDCPRPANGSGWCQDYCSSFHAALALNEGPPGMGTVIRPGGIGLKDNLLFDALSAKAMGKDVGIPECEGAATAKSPWNAPELFDLYVLEGETMREWLFFDKPRRAFESGNRKQRSLPDYSGRGWHESRKQLMSEFGGLKRSYYMDPQPMNHYELHLYEYEISKCDVCALYRLELKVVEGKKNAKAKITSDSVSDLQKQMGRLSSEFPSDNKRSAKGREKFNANVSSVNVYSASRRVVPANATYEYDPTAPGDYLLENINGYYIT